VERLLGKTQADIERLARETLTGNLRGVLSKLTPEQVNEDRLGFAEHLSEEADHDLKKLGLQLDVLKIQHVSDNVGYLLAIGEKATAEALRDAEIAKANAVAETRLRQAEAKRVAEVAAAMADAQIKQQQAEATRMAQVAQAEAEALVKESQAQARQRAEVANATADAEIRSKQASARQVAEVAQANADVTISEAKNALRVRQAELAQLSETAEKVAHANALRAESEAQTSYQQQRVETERTRLQADVVQPAEAARIAAEASAKASAAPILESGRAQAEVLALLFNQIAKGGDHGLQVFLAEKMPAMLGVTVDAMKDIQIDRLTIVDGGNGNGVANATAQKVNASIRALEQVAGAMGLDLDVFFRKMGSAAGRDGAAAPDGPVTVTLPGAKPASAPVAAPVAAAGAVGGGRPLRARISPSAAAWP
jgi:flotillin